MTETLLSIVILATPGEYSELRLLTKSPVKNTLPFITFVSAPLNLPNFFINELDLTTNNEYSGRVASFNAMWQERYTPLNFC